MPRDTPGPNSGLAGGGLEDVLQAGISDPHQLGETKSLAAEHPDWVKDLDARIDAFLADTGAPVPKANPAYDLQVAMRRTGC